MSDVGMFIAGAVAIAVIPSWLHMIARGLPNAPRPPAPRPAVLPRPHVGRRVDPAPSPAVIEPGPSVTAHVHDLRRDPAPYRQSLGSVRKAIDPSARPTRSARRQINPPGGDHA